MDAREETLEILKSKFGLEDAYKVLDYFESRLRVDVATQKDIYELKLAIEKVRADLAIEIEANRTEIEKVRADLSKDIEKVRADLSKDIEKVRADLSIKIEANRSEIERVRASLLKWSFGFWFTQMAILVGILLRLLS